VKLFRLSFTRNT